MKFKIFILMVFVLFKTRGTTAVENSDGKVGKQSSISSVIRSYGGSLDKFYINRTFEFENCNLQHSVPLSTQLRLKSVANNLLFSRTRIARFCNVTRDSRSINKDTELSFVTDIEKYLTNMKQSIPLDFIAAGDHRHEPAAKLSPLVVFQTTTAVFLRHIDDALSTISSVTENSIEAILQACNETDIDHSPTELQKPFIPCANDAVSQSTNSSQVATTHSFNVFLMYTLTLANVVLMKMIFSRR